MDSTAVTIVTLFCTIMGTVIAFQTFKKKEVDEPATEQKMLIEKFELLNKLNFNLCNDINQYCSQNNCHNEIFMQGLTYAQSLEILNRVREGLLTLDNKDLLSDGNLPGPRVKSLMAHFDTQIKNHCEIDTYIKYYTPISQTESTSSE